MNGLIALIGSGEYLPVMQPVDRYLLETLQLDRPPRVACLATAAGQEGYDSVNRWLSMGVAHFEGLGAQVQALWIIDKASANDEQYQEALEQADFIYFSGGNPAYLFETLHGSLAWDAMQKSWQRGAVYAGCSAGAMILSERIPTFRLGGTQQGFGLVPAKFIIPHFDAIPRIWKPLVLSLRRQLKNGERLIGVDENTALVGRLHGDWTVMGVGKTYIYTRQGTQVCGAGETLRLD